MKTARFARITAGSFLLVLSLSSAWAQYAWIDEKGVKQYSDRPPPPAIPQSRILKQPGRHSSPAAQTTPNASDTGQDSGKNDPAPAAKTPMTTAEQNAEFKKRQAAQAEKEKKAEEEAKIAADRAKNCERARNYSRSLEAGDRIARSDKNGERSFLTDEERAKEAEEARRFLDGCK